MAKVDYSVVKARLIGALNGLLSMTRPLDSISGIGQHARGIIAMCKEIAVLMETLESVEIAENDKLREYILKKLDELGADTHDIEEAFYTSQQVPFFEATNGHLRKFMTQWKADQAKIEEQKRKTAEQEAKRQAAKESG